MAARALHALRVLRPTAASLRYLGPTATRRLASSSKSADVTGEQDDTAVKESIVTDGR